MQYVFVGSWKRPKKEELNYTLASVRQAGNILISLIDVLQKGNFSLGAPDFFLEEIKSLKSQLTTEKLYLDSGGYSIIAGDVKGSDIKEFLERYFHCMRLCKDVYDYIFSLDIPIFLGEPQYNNIESLTRFNHMSMDGLKTYLQHYPELKEKVLFVYQFKIQDQYDIWTKLYSELNLKENVQYRSIGGMVGLRGITQINFSPFIGPLFKCLYDYKETNYNIQTNGYIGNKFKVHNLGVYIQHDRLFLCLLEKLFNRYLKRDDTEITYDSVNYMRTAQLRAKNLKIYSFRSGNDIEIFQHIETPDEILRQVYSTPELYNGIKEEIERCKKGLNLLNIDAFTPLNVYSNVQLDRFFDYIVDRYRLVDMSLSYEKWKTPLMQILNGFPHIFSSRRIVSLTENFQHLWQFQKWFLKDGTINGLQSTMNQFIKAIQFPAHLEDVYIHPGNKTEILENGGLQDESE